MPKFFWVGQTPTANLGLSPFKWNNTNNWRQERASSGTQEFITVQSVPTRVPAIASGVDEVFIGYPIVDTSGNKIPARSPLLFGGCTGNVSIAGSLTGGMTWEHGSITGPVYLSIGATFSADQSLFRMFYPYPMIGGGITGGNGYFASFQAVKDWVKSTYNFSDSTINSIFSAANLAAEPNKNHLKIKALTVTEQFNTTDSKPLTISMQIPRTYAKGTTFAATIYDRRSNNTTTILNNSVLLTVLNTASRANSVDPYTGAQGPSVNTNNNFALDSCVLNRYEGYYDDNVNIKSNCSVTSAEVFSPKYLNVSNNTYEFVKDNFQLNFGGKYGITYTGAILGLSGMVQANDGTLRLNSTKNNFGMTYDYDHKINIGQEAGITSYFQTITSYNNSINFVGPVIANTMNSYNSYIVNGTAIRRDKDPVNIVYLNMRDASKLDLSYNYSFDLWYFGQLPSGQTLVQGGVFSTGYDSMILGSPGVKLFNDIMVYSTNLGNRDTGTAKRRTDQETFIGTQPPTAPSVSL